MLGTVTGLLATGAHDVMVISPHEASSTSGIGSRGTGSRGTGSRGIGRGVSRGEVNSQSVVEGRELLIPFARRYVLEVDLSAGRIIVDWAAV